MRKIAKAIFPFFCILFGAYFLSSGSFSIQLVSGPLFSSDAQALPLEAKSALAQGYSYLGKGRQAFAFVSQDGKWVLKFFNQKYHRMPFYASFWEKERLKREKRLRFYLESYRLAASELAEETGIIYLHFAPSSEKLPALNLKDRKGRSHIVDLNKIPFVLQKKADSFYPAIESMPLEKGITQFVELIANRIEHGIADADHDVENNFGVCSGRVIQLDPGRLHSSDRLSDPSALQQEWWSSTHRFRKWLEEKHPELVSFFDNEVLRVQN